MQHGRIKSWLDARGFGFITLDVGGPDIFLHRTDLPRSGTGVVPAVGDGVVCEVETTEKGLRARGVQFEMGYQR